MKKIIALVLLGGCAYSGASFHVDEVVEWKAAGNVVSVFGLYRDGRMNGEAWKLMGADIARGLGSERCELFYGERLAKDDPALFEKIDAETKQDGVTTELLGSLAARAEAPLIMMLQLSGRPPDPLAPYRGNIADRGGSVAARKGHGRRPPLQAQAAPSENNVFEVYVSLFATESRRRVFELTMRYSGESVEDALQKLGSKLRDELPGATCRGWKWPAPPAPPADAP